jgi:hypothetical protein
MTISLVRRLLDASSSLPGSSAGPDRSACRLGDNYFLFGLAPGGVCLARPVTKPAGALLPHRFTLTRLSPGGLLSVALSRALRPVGVTHHHVLWSPDFPPALDTSGLIAQRAAASAFAPATDQRPFGHISRRDRPDPKPAVIQSASNHMHSTI